MPEEPSLFCSLFVVVLKVPGATDPFLVFCAVVSSYEAVEMVTSLYKAFFFKIFLQFLNVSINVISANGISKEVALFSSHCQILIATH